MVIICFPFWLPNSRGSTAAWSVYHLIDSRVGAGRFLGLYSPVQEGVATLPSWADGGAGTLQPGEHKGQFHLDYGQLLPR
jgi:hypothetical protein